MTYVTAWAAFLGYVVALVLRLRGSDPLLRQSRIWWTAGCVMMSVHMACAFHEVHHWSHDAAFEATARQTAELTGFASGSGVYVNYIVLALWLVDVCWWWQSPAHHESKSARKTQWLLQAFFAFVWFNATVVFGHGLIQWAGAAAWLLLAILFWRHQRLSPQN